MSLRMIPILVLHNSPPRASGGQYKSNGVFARILVVQAVSDRCRKIPDHRTPNSRAVLNRREGSSSSVRIRASTVTLRSRRPSCNASRAASRPIRRSNRKQSTIVRAGEVMRAGTPLNTASRTPYVQAEPLKRTRRVRICGSRGGLALW